MKYILYFCIIITLIISSCNTPIQETTLILEITDTPTNNSKAAEGDESPVEIQADAPYLDASLPIDERVDDLLNRMTLDEKIGQMTQVEKGSITPAEVKMFAIGSVLSGGGGSPSENTTEAWAKMVDSYQEAALGTRLRIPIIYGVDAVHGHANLQGATFFPHNIDIMADICGGGDRINQGGEITYSPYFLESSTSFQFIGEGDQVYGLIDSV